MSPKNIVVFSGGSAANNLVDVFGRVAQANNCSLSYVIPISDNGGSSSELIRVFGGPGIGDIRSRLVRLIPEDVYGNDAEKSAIKTFFNHRLAASSDLARSEWLDIVEARHHLWSDISSEKRELIRSFINTINLEIVKRARPSSVFNFESASVGNLFLTGARLFTGSFESAIYLLGSITGIPSNISVIPAINSNFSHHICARLKDGSIIVGQNAISHPSTPTTIPALSESVTLNGSNDLLLRELIEHDRVEDANLPGSLPSLRKQYIAFQKDHVEDLPSRIDRMWYINPYGQEIRPAANKKVIESTKNAQCIIYSIGSLYTSIVPCLILKDVGQTISRPSIHLKVLILNGSIDRETGPSDSPFSAKDFIAAIADACASSRGLANQLEQWQWRDYVTHLIHLEGAGAPTVEKEELKDLGIETIRIYGRKSPAGSMIYDEKALVQTLEALLGRRDSRAEQGRRNTLQN